MIPKGFRWISVGILAATLALMQWIAGGRVTGLWWHTLAVAAVVAVVVGLIPWDRWLFRLRPGTAWFEASLFILLVRHFALVFLGEARRLLVARQMAAPVRYGPGWFRSLAWALVAYFNRVVVRAERFYVSLLLRS